MAWILQKGFPFRTVSGPNPSKRLPAASNWTGISFTGRESPFWTVSGPDPSKRLPAASNWTGISFTGRESPFWTVSGPDPSKRLPAASNWAGFSFSGRESPFWTLRAAGRLFEGFRPLRGQKGVSRGIIVFWSWGVFFFVVFIFLGRRLRAPFWSSDPRLSSWSSEHGQAELETDETAKMII